jgi:methionine-gamma-lyase
LFLIGSPFTESASASAENRVYSIVARDDERARSFPIRCGGKANGEWKANPKTRFAIPFLEPDSGKTIRGNRVEPKWRLPFRARLVQAAAIMKKHSRRKSHGDATLAIHAGEERFHVGAPVGVSIARTANFTFKSTEEMKRWAEGKSSAYIYTRYGNPTLAIAEQKIAALERAEAAIVTASGMAAISSSLLAVLKAGDEVISTPQLYGGTYRLMRDVLPRCGIVVRHVQPDLAGIERLASARTKALYIETPSNPTLRLVDLRKAVAFAKEWGLVSLIDNTFSSPVLQKPIELGFNIVLHSATKFLAGHSDVIAGAAAGSRVLIDKVRQNIINL